MHGSSKMWRFLCCVAVDAGFKGGAIKHEERVFGVKGKRAGSKKMGFVGKYNRTGVFNFAEISGTLRVDSRFYLSYCRSRSGSVPRDGICLGNNFERSSHLGKPKILQTTWP